MISRVTLTYWTYPIRMGLLLHCIPYQWNWKKKGGDHLEMVYTRLWHFIAYFNIVFRAIVITCIITVTLRGHFDAVTNVLSLFFISIYTFSIIMQSILLIHYQNIHAFINKMLRLNQQLLRYYGIPPDFVDGLEGVAKTMKVAITIALCANFPSGVVLINKGVGVFQAIRSPHPIVNVLTALVWTFFQATDWNITLFYSYLTVIYVNAAQHWVGMLVWKRRMRLARKVTFRIFYRAHQILHSMALEFFGALMLLHISAGGIMMITSFYSVIKFPYKKSHVPILVRVGLTGVVAVIQFTVYQVRARTTRDNSEEYPRSFLLNENYIRKYDRRFFKSCRPLKFQTGPTLSYCRRDFFLIFIEGIVIRNTINLLLTFK